MSQELIDLQFDRAVEIVQGLPKNGPIQTGYDEKLAMYSLYKQATVGNVTTPRPSMFDMLGRAKYDAWAKQKDLDPKEAKARYVETLLKVLRKYGDATIAKSLVEELGSYGDPSGVGMSGSWHRSESESGSGGSEESEEQNDHTDNDSTDEVDVIRDQEPADDDRDETYHQSQPPAASVPDLRRPGSAVSSQRYRTPMAGSTINVPIPSHVLSPSGTPAMQSLPEHAAPSAYAPSISPHHSASLAQQFSGGAERSISPRQMVPAISYGQYRGTPSFQRGQQFSRPPLERAVESMQASLAALHERLESLETVLGYGTAGGPGASRTSVHSQRSRIPSPHRNGTNETPWPRWDISNMGAWSFVLQPLSRLENNLRVFAQFVAQNDDTSPILIIIRRLFLDLSFLILCLLIAKSIWRRTKLGRSEVVFALRGVWRALTGQRAPRVMVEKGV